MPLPILPLLVGRPGQRLHPLEARRGEGHKGADQIAMFSKTPVSERQYCKTCGGHIMANHPPLGVVDVYSATIPTLDFKPEVHLNYQETVLPIKDGLPKLKDFPKEFGGSGEMIAE